MATTASSLLTHPGVLPHALDVTLPASPIGTGSPWLARGHDMAAPPSGVIRDVMYTVADGELGKNRLLDGAQPRWGSTGPAVARIRARNTCFDSPR
jgi:hypothetical protein